MTHVGATASPRPTPFLMRLVFLALVAGVGAELHYVADPCGSGNDPTTVLSAPICMQSESDTEVAVSVRPPTQLAAGYTPTNWQVRTRCCDLARPATFCDSQDANDICYPGWTTGMTWSAAAEACANDGRRLCSVAELSACCGTGCSGDDYLSWTEDVCTPPSPPPSPSPPPPHQPVCTYYVMDQTNNVASCPTHERITSEGACTRYYEWLRDEGGMAASGFAPTAILVMDTREDATWLAGGCNVLITEPVVRVRYNLNIDKLLADATISDHKAVCGGCYPPSVPPPSPPPPSPPPPVPRTVFQPRQCVTTADGVARCIQIEEGHSLDDERVQAMIERHFGSAVPPPSPPPAPEDSRGEVYVLPAGERCPPEDLMTMYECRDEHDNPTSSWWTKPIEPNFIAHLYNTASPPIGCSTYEMPGYTTTHSISFETNDVNDPTGGDNFWRSVCKRGARDPANPVPPCEYYHAALPASSAAGECPAGHAVTTNEECLAYENYLRDLLDNGHVTHPVGTHVQEHYNNPRTNVQGHPTGCSWRASIDTWQINYEASDSVNGPYATGLSSDYIWFVCRTPGACPDPPTARRLL